MNRTHVTSVINQNKFCINKNEEHELHKHGGIPSALSLRPSMSRSLMRSLASS